MRSAIGFRLPAVFCLLSIFMLTVASVGQELPGQRNGKIAFSYNVNNNDVEIYTINSDGSGLTQLTDSVDLGKSHPAWSPDGRKVAFLSQIGYAKHELRIVDADGSNQKTLTTTNDIYPSRGIEQNLSWSPDGRKIAFASNWDIFTINVDGSGLANLTNNPIEEGEPDWSPDGSKIAFTRMVVAPQDSGFPLAAIHLMDSNGNNVERRDDGAHANKPNWAPDGQRFAYLYDDYQGPGVGLLAIHQAGILSGDYVWSFDWSPDGQKFAVSTFFINPGLYLINADGGSRTQILSGIAIQPDWQPLTLQTGSLSGRVLTSQGQGLRNAIVFLTDDQGARRTVVTSSLGYYTFDGVISGKTYEVGVSSKRYRFETRSLSLDGNLTNVDFTGLQ